MKEEAKGQNKREIPPSVAAHQMASVTFHTPDTGINQQSRHC